ncbi:ribosomal protein L7/L12 [Streptomyces sp. NBC_00201]|uniref:ribosomal protein L7/L12 n=1 Tax=unclassified Streptomyces TaxID=2593676 RepID=UPI00225A6CF6|nr:MULTISPECIES: ribosomal protein L7/L12 [unclassified Streptomyces]MCX5055609.1 ribosomal protein L7/L12 [Streptomyces sp. NBC_00452]MCX5247545.1 ribosomal protein L7/L12 [Streptomyces sp. NBC_00201]MCX5286674.1 ribosomal protein L7/L12 [Streptomyces sp. NBC_00183]
MDTLGFSLIALLILFGIGSIESRISRQDKRVARVEHKLDLILDHLGLREREPWADEVDALLRDGKKIAAIKVYREATGAGLKEAKEAVDKLG